MSQLFSFGVGRREVGKFWREARDGDAGALELYRRHYSRRIYADGRETKLFVGPGEKLVLVNEEGNALFAWRRFIDDSGQIGINCAVFRNESSELSSLMIVDADAIAFKRWPGVRHYTYVDSAKIRSTNPGSCFIHAGWNRCGVTKKRGLVILERLA